MDQMKDLAKEIRECRKCKLCDTRQNAVVGRGSMNPKVLFIGEAPGKSEDREGIPFIGRSGQLLDIWIQRLKLTPDDYAITNVVKCFPNENGKIRAPEPDEVDACKEYLDKQIELLKPQYIVTLGKFAMQYFFPNKKGILNEVGKHYDYNGIKVFIFVHPSYFLRGNTKVDWKEMISPFYKELNNEELVIKKKEESKLIYDIETVGLDPRKGYIKRIGFWSYKYDKYIVTSDPKEALRIINDHDTLIGYNIKKFDNEWMEVYAGKIYPFSLDLYEVMTKRLPIIKETFDDLKLDTVCNVFGLGRKMKIDKDIVCGENKTEEDKKKLDEYLKQDVMITKALYEYLEDQFSVLKPYLSESDIKSYKHLLTSTGSFCYKAICRLADLPEEYGDDYVGDVKYKGAFVAEPSREVIKGKIYCFDFSSAYPHAYMMQNLYSHADENDMNSYNGNKLYTLIGKYKTDKMGKIESVIKELYNKRLEYKKAKDKREYAIKIIINTMYGISGNPIFKSVFDIHTASDCTHTVQEWIKYARRVFKNGGYEVLYSDTDSVYVLDHLNNENVLIEIKNKLINDIKSMMPFPQETFDMGIDERIKAMFFFKDVKYEREKKKHYIYITEDDRIVIKGLPIIKRNASRLSKAVLKVLKPQIIKNLDCRFKKSYIDNIIKEKLKKDITLATTRIEVKELNKYKKSPNGLHASISRKHGAGIHYLVKNKKIGIGKGVKYCTIEEGKKLRFDDLDLTTIWSELSPFIKEETPQSLNIWFKK